MRAFALTDFGAAPEIVDIPLPEPAEGRAGFLGVDKVGSAAGGLPPIGVATPGGTLPNGEPAGRDDRVAWRRTAAPPAG